MIILQDSKTLATWSQLKLIKNATRKEMKPFWFKSLEATILQDLATRKIKDDFCINADLNRLAISNLQNLLADKRVKD
ncbi:36700_t:CDS:2 [Gigaspora margarita]|uniref:36700_t:CDS:1 n=1 Tax=Gigaspora margarita TaxID=4874 RepID=A0ABN7UK52_GIGMA|nr:36700_t:CDS:2 [Gigaspora margarita]